MEISEVKNTITKIKSSGSDQQWNERQSKELVDTERKEFQISSDMQDCNKRSNIWDIRVQKGEEKEGQPKKV